MKTARAFGHSTFLFLLATTLTAFSTLSQAFTLPDFTSLVEKHGPAVVNISTIQKTKNWRGQPFLAPQQEDIPEIFRYFFGETPTPPQNQEKQSLGSGFFISNDGYILTNQHVIQDADEIYVRLTDRREFKADLIGQDKRSDLALLKIKGSEFPTVNLGQSESLKVGEWVVAIGSPYGFENTVTAGIVSAKGRSLPQDNYVPFIQTDVAINPGNSGGPLFNLDGEVIGLNAQIFSRTGGFMGLSFAIPIDMALEVVAQLKEDGHVSRGWLGVLIQEVDRDLAESFGLEKPAGALVAEILQDSPAKDSNLKPGDVILKYNNAPLDLASDLPPLVGRSKPGDVAKLHVMRNGKRKTIKVTIGELPHDENDITAATPSKQSSSQNRLNIQVEALTDSQKKRWELKHGVSVSYVGSGPAKEADIRSGDIITLIGGEKVTSIRTFKTLVAELEPNKVIPMQIHRRGRARFVAIKIKESP